MNICVERIADDDLGHNSEALHIYTGQWWLMGFIDSTAIPICSKRFYMLDVHGLKVAIRSLVFRGARNFHS